MAIQWDAVGISIQIVSTFLAALAYVLQKKAHLRVQSAVAASGGGASASGSGEVDSAAAVAAAWAARANRGAVLIWRWGFGLMIVCALLDLSTYPMLDLSKQAPLGAATLVFNSILAAIILAEPFTVLDLLSTTAIFAGTIIAVSNSEEQSTDFTFQGIIELLNDGLVIGYSAVVIPALLASVFYIERSTRADPSKWTAGQRRLLSLLSPAAGGMFMGFTGYCAKSLSTVVAGQEWFEVRGTPRPAFTPRAASVRVRSLTRRLPPSFIPARSSRTPSSTCTFCWPPSACCASCAT